MRQSEIPVGPPLLLGLDLNIILQLQKYDDLVTINQTNGILVYRYQLVTYLRL